MVGEDDRALMRAVARYLESVNGLPQWERAERNPGRFKVHYGYRQSALATQKCLQFRCSRLLSGWTMEDGECRKTTGS